ncbi:SUMO protease ULP1 [Aspergillus ruber CBS 135680]|uniref:Ubiquitin-like protease family profile domain-containing protein n=1 Tax=Aspergillus ruber (strain CBS 135680) TaxID=1388766 RepID=A0A017S7J0_ASPRC|nr:uncharacterized protein EURHEDRAFT_414882 [Aspergillus ruber CBS 135680]EYE92932.1 hypothetical protein EURHEDRAFT_414882 [Aspergillus ruber CBS 135680]
MTGVVATQQREMGDEVMNDVALLSPDAPRLNPALVYSPGDPMDISPMPAANHQRQFVFEQQPSQHGSRRVEQATNKTFNNSPRPSFTNDRPVLSSTAGYVKPDGNDNNNKPSSGLPNRRTIFQPHRFSPKNRASVKQGHLKRLPLAMQAKLGTPYKPALVGMNRNFRILPTSNRQPGIQSNNNHFTLNGYPSLELNHVHDLPTLDPPVNRQLFKPAPPIPALTNSATGPASDETAAKPTSEQNTAAASEQTASGDPREPTREFSLQRTPLIKGKLNDIDIDRPATYVSPKYRKLSQRSSDPATTSPAHDSQQTTSAQEKSHSNLYKQPSLAHINSSNLISPFKPNLSTNKTPPMGTTNDSKHNEAWNDMLELQDALRNQVTSPESASKTQEPVNSTPAPEPQAFSTSSQDAVSIQAQSLEAGQDEQPKDDTSHPSFSWSNQLWGATQSVVATAIALADTFKRRAIALFEEPRPPSRRTSHTTTSSSPTRANLRMLPEEQRRRLKSNQWRIDRGFPTVQDYPFPELSLDTPQFQATTDALLEGEAPKPVTPDFKKPISSDESSRKRGIFAVTDGRRQSAKSGINKRHTFQALSPNIKRRMNMRSGKRNIARTRLDRSLGHAVQTGKWTLDDLPTKPKGPVAPVPNRKRRLELAATEAVRQKRAAPKKVRFVLQSAPPDNDPALVGHHLHPGLMKTLVEEEKENEPPKHVEREPEAPDPGLRSWLQSDFPFGRPVSAVRLFAPGAKVPQGRSESIFAVEWRKIQEEEKAKQVPARIRPEGPAVRPLPPKWEARLAEAKASPENRQIATTLSGDPLTKRDLATCYTPARWLNDEVINAYLAILIDYLRRANGNAGRHDKPKFHAFNTFFFSNLRDKGYSSVSRWAKRAKIGGEALLEVDTVYIPVHNSAHWTLMVVKPTEKSIEYFDSLGSASPHHVAIVKDWLRGELSARYIEEEWSVVPTVSPQQDNGSDCGVFLLSTAKAVSIGIEPLSYGARDIPLLRRKIVVELMAGGLDGDFKPEGETGEVLM